MLLQLAYDTFAPKAAAILAFLKNNPAATAAILKGLQS
jgi:hypothetical protein